MSLKEKFTKGVAWSLVETVGVKIFSVATFFVLAKVLGPEPFGVVALTNSFIMISLVLTEEGLVYALIQKKNVTDEDLSSAFWGNLLLGGAIYALNYAVAPLLARVFEEPIMTEVLRVYGITFIIGAIGSIPRGLLERNFAYNKIAYGRISGIFLGGVVSIWMAFADYGVWSLVAQSFLFALVQNVFFWMSVDWRPRAFFRFVIYRELLYFSAKILLNSLISNFNKYAYNFLIGYTISTAAVGYFSFALKIFNTAGDVINLSASKVLLPTFSTLFNEGSTQLKRIFSQMIHHMFYLGLPLYVALGVVLPDAVLLFFSEKWQASIVCIQLLAASGFCILLKSVYGSFIVGVGKPELATRIDIVNLVAGVTTLLALVNFGLAGAAASYGLKYVVSTVFILRQIHRNYFSVTEILRDSIKPLLLYTALAGGLLLLQQVVVLHPIVELVGVGMLWLGLSATIVFYFDPGLVDYRKYLFKKA